MAEVTCAGLERGANVGPPTSQPQAKRTGSNTKNHTTGESPSRKLGKKTPIPDEPKAQFGDATLRAVDRARNSGTS